MMNFILEAGNTLDMLTANVLTQEFHARMRARIKGRKCQEGLQQSQFLSIRFLLRVDFPSSYIETWETLS